MNNVELRRLIGRHVKRFDGVFGSNELPADPILTMQIRSTSPGNTGL